MTTKGNTTFFILVHWDDSSTPFSEVSGLEKEKVAAPEPAVPVQGNKGKEQLHWGSTGRITLKKGVIPGNSGFCRWITATGQKTVEKHDVVISLMNEQKETVLSWKLEKAFPVKVNAGSLQSNGQEVAIESVELAHEGMNMLS